MSEPKPARLRPICQFTLSPAVAAYLKDRSASLGMSRSAMVESLVRAAMAKDDGLTVLTHAAKGEVR